MGTQVIRPERYVLQADASGNIALIASAGVGFKLESCPTDASGKTTTPGAFPVDMYFDGQQTRTFRVVAPGFEEFGGTVEHPAFVSLGALNATANGCYLLTIYKAVGQGAVSSQVVRGAVLLGSGSLGGNGVGANTAQFDVSQYSGVRADFAGGTTSVGGVGCNLLDVHGDGTQPFYLQGGSTTPGNTPSWKTSLVMSAGLAGNIQVDGAGTMNQTWLHDNTGGQASVLMMSWRPRKVQLSASSGGVWTMNWWLYGLP